MKRTQRGFAIYGAYKDSRNNVVRIQESSSAAGPHVWIFTNDRDGRDAIIHLGQPHSVSPHLTPAQARRVAQALERFADEHSPKRRRARR
jgi:hypothetical protein